MTTRTLLVASAVAWVAALVGLVWMIVLAEFRPRYLPSLLTEMDMALQACAVLSVVSAVWAVFSVRAGARRRAVLGIAGAFGWGAVGGLLGAVSARNGLICTNDPLGRRRSR